MRSDKIKIIARLFRLSWATVIGAVTIVMLLSAGRIATAATQSSEVSFNLTQLPENPRQYSLIISDEDEHTISGSFSVDQLQILRAIMAEADKFALTAEAAGDKQPITTRFMDKHEHSFIVDVQKIGPQSGLFLTVTTEIGQTTVEAGKTNRATMHREGFFFKLLSRLDSTLPKPPPSK